MSAVLIWRAEPLNARLIASARPAALQFTAAARAKAPSKTVRASIVMSGTATVFTVASTSPLGAFFEKGVGPHEIAPRKKKALKLASGRFVSGPVQHPGIDAQPFLRPLLPFWGNLYRRQAAGAFRGI